VMAALTRDVVDFHGKYFDFSNVPIELKPYQLPHPPLWYATNSAESAARAARQNTNIVTLIDAVEAGKVIRSYKESWNAAHGASGKKMPRAGITRFIYVGDSDGHARERGEFGSRKFYESLVYLWRKFNVTAMSLEEVIRSAAATLITGTPATVRAKIEKELEESGANYYVPRFAYGNLTHEESVRSLELFTSEVMPHFQK
jgi:alkanesulfonate monooxygenase SsuD/methylene tetrahydromethanopterin reductase-like flavin-dependent oxidoreductase (luciferase family)